MRLAELLDVADGFDYVVTDNDGYDYSIEESMECRILSVQPSSFDKTLVVLLDV